MTLNDFQQQIQSGTVLVDFWAPWCGPCQMLSPVLDEIAQEHPEIKLIKINVEEDADLSNTIGISAIPQVHVFKDGKPQEVVIGNRAKEEYLKLIG